MSAISVRRRERPLCLLVAGARPNFMKVAPIIRALRVGDVGFDHRLVHTGQHYDDEMSGVFFRELGIPEPEFSLRAGGVTQAEQTARIMTAFERVCEQQRPELVLVVGDVNSTLACAIVAKKARTGLAHVEAGLRSRDLSMPEEINRIVTDALADDFFVTERSAIDNLRAEGKPESAIHFVGHTMIDNLLYQEARLEERRALLTRSEELRHSLPRYAVLTLHRPANVDDRDRLAHLLQALGRVAREIAIVFPVHPRSARNLQQFGLTLPQGVVPVSPLSYMEFLNLWRSASFVLTDSGGLQEETTALGVPCLTLRDNTERPVTVEEGTNILVGTDPELIEREASRILRGGGKRGRRPPLWDGRAAERIVPLLQRRLTAAGHD